MVLVILGTLQFEAERFEARTMPTPDMKNKEMIYWIKLSTSDRRLISDLRRYLEGSGRFVDLRVPGAFIWAKTEIEDYSFPEEDSLSRGGARLRERRLVEGKDGEKGEGLAEVQEKFSVEIILRRLVTPETQKVQSPYG